MAVQSLVPDYRLEMNKGIRIDRLDRLDQISYHQRLRGNFVKWWTVNVLPAEEEGDEAEASGQDAERDDAYDPDAAAEELLNEALGLQSDESDEIDMSDPATAEAMEIFARLQAEAEADEAAKQAEIEAAKIAAQFGNSQSNVSDLVQAAGSGSV